MSWTTRVHVRRALAGPAAAAVLMGAGATATGLLAPQRASALVACPVLTVSPQSYFSTGMEQCFTAPAGVSSIHAALVGGTGGGGDPFGATPGAGGHAAQVTADVAVTRGGHLRGGRRGRGRQGVLKAMAASTAAPPGARAKHRRRGWRGHDLRTVAATLVACDGGTTSPAGPRPWPRASWSRVVVVAAEPSPASRRRGGGDGGPAA